ncbi:unnamed protein product [Mucor hiemalis]
MKCNSLVMRFVKDHFDEYRESTIGAAFLAQTVSLDDNTTVKLKFGKLSSKSTMFNSQERYKSLAPMYYRNANCAVVVYDITQASSLDKAKAWVNELQRQADPNIVIALAGNKSDLDGRRAIETSTAQEYADECGLLFLKPLQKLPITNNGRKRGGLNTQNVDLDNNGENANGCAC